MMPNEKPVAMIEYSGNRRMEMVVRSKWRRSQRQTVE